MFPLGQWSASTLRKGEKSVADAGVKLAPMSSFKKFFIWETLNLPGHQKRAWPRKSPQMNWGQ